MEGRSEMPSTGSTIEGLGLPPTGGVLGQSERSKFLGGTDAAAIVGASKWRTPLQVWMEKTGQAQPSREENLAMRYGRYNEEFVAGEFERAMPHLRVLPGERLVHPQYPFLVGSLDRWLMGEDGERIHVLEVKTAGSWEGWGEPDTDQVPLDYLAQVMHYQNLQRRVLGPLFRDHEAYLVVLIGGRDLRTYRIPFRADLVDALEAEEIRFWNEHVVPRRPPDPLSGLDALARWPAADAARKPVVCPVELYPVLDELHQIAEKEKALESDKDRAQAAIKSVLQDADTLVDDKGVTLATWRNFEAERLDAKRLRAERPEVAAEYLKASQTRRFVLAGLRGRSKRSGNP